MESSILQIKNRKKQIVEIQYRKLSKEKRKLYYLSHQRPCGECLGCLLDNAKQWGISIS